ncbi:hypothetical protein FSP39_017478 [Pinctada imbricata]|uniref:Uncharacterized protein n=1 Tax=Pinctada imbricata TaxID=66713 RepID=A0AA88Y9U5_PINIB|nr:hypothetical protein FSP39_017478 [Pinctada imbricata]
MSNGTVEPSDMLQVLLAATPDKRRSEVQGVFNEKGYTEAVGYLWENVLDTESKLEAEHAVGSHDSENKYYKLLVTDFNIKQHFSQVCSHRKFVKKAYFKLRPYLNYMKADDAEKHDLSKFMLAQAVGYTARWVHNTDNASWQTALNHHYCNEPHHPEYYKNKDGVKERMEARYLEESLVDMAGSRWERQLQGREDVSLEDLVDFNPVYLKRYHPEDKEIVLELIKDIQDNPAKQ